MHAAFLVFAAAASLDFVPQLGGRLDRNAQGAVTGVHLRGGWIADADLDAIAATPTLETLDLSLTRITDLGLLRLKGLANVREMNLFFAELVTDEGLATMRNWQRIERLNLRGTKVTDNTLALLAGKDSIVALDIGYAEVTDSGLQQLTRLRGLRELAFGGNKMTEVGLQVLRSLPMLTRLDIAGKQRTDSGLWSVTITDAGLDPVATLADLRELNLSGHLVTSRGIEKLRGLKKLERLNLYGARRVGDDAAPHLAAMTALRWVDLKDTGVTGEGIASLRKSRPGLVSAGDPANEPVEHFKVEFENEQFRAVRVSYGPRERSSLHEHPETPMVIYVYLTDGGEMRVVHDDGRDLVRPPVQAGGIRVARGGKEKHEVTNLSDKASQYVRVEIRAPLTEKLTKDQRFEPVMPTVAEQWQRVVFENADLRVTRLACPTRGSCQPNESRGLDIHLASGATQYLRRGAPARFNETPLPLDLLRVELKGN